MEWNRRMRLLNISLSHRCLLYIFFDYFNKPRPLSLSRLKEKYRKDVWLFIVDVVDKWMKSWFCFLFYDRYVYKCIQLSTNIQKRAYPFAFLFSFFFPIRLGVDLGTLIVCNYLRFYLLRSSKTISYKIFWYKIFQDKIL